MANDKFKLTEESKELDNGSTVFRIEALNDFNDVKKGQKGGFIESEDNLSFKAADNSWVYDEASVSGNSVVEVDSFVDKGSQVHNSHVLNDSRVGYDSKVVGSLVQESEVQSSTMTDSKSFTSQVGQSQLENSEVVFSNVGDTKVKNSFMESVSSTYDSEVINSHIEEETLQEGKIENFDSRTTLEAEDLEDLNDLDEELTQ